ncbi:hypothetical protein [Paenibacillus sacheonensis]|uniref:Uncharacterized protein n=1 Tax=Paenibacillus sacheonensis TaxID=742054 RepID=A0A7X5C3G8_9BACL|nr:hypothetical protein [Paenibacillus sacheonensis]MBM7568519.1 hypothetical protein [Paenibacillus sacheonensis]NBC72345.1 hypothetical protein [Paenibacillus sacheonensis]
MIVHYSRDINSAASILSSKELWLTRVGSMSEQDDILFYMNEFNRLHYTQDLIATFKQALKLMVTTPNLNQKQFFTHTFLAAQLRKVAYQNGVSLGGSLTDLIKQHSFVASFNETEAAAPDAANGEIAFEFESNPLTAPRGFQLLFNKVHYTDAEKVKKLKADNDDDMTQFMDGIAQENTTFTNILAAYISKLEKQQLAYTNVIHDVISGLMEDNRGQEEAYTPLDLYSQKDTVDMVNFIHSFIVEDFTTTFRKETGQKLPTKNEIKQILDQNPDMAKSTWIDLRSLLVKDSASSQENEVRALLLPQNKKQFGQQKKHYPLAFNTDKLRRIVISPNCENRAEWKAKLEDVLITNKYANVTVE